MNMKSFIKRSFPIGFFLLLASFSGAKGEVRLPRIFESNMVLQRDVPIPVWGWAAPGEGVSITLNGASVAVKADRKGKWMGKLPAMPAGGPFALVIKGKNTLTLSGVLIGDVWLCGGQSNMQWRIDQTGYQEQDTAFLRSAPVRLFTVHIEMDYMPRDNVKGSGWQVLSKQHADAFSAVAYHFGKYLHGQLNVPIGLISNNLGATSIETWMSNEALLSFPQFEIGSVVKQGKSFAQLDAAFQKTKPEWYRKYYYTGMGIDQQWYTPETDVSDWKPIKASGNTWEMEPDLKDHDGAVWFRTAFDLPENFTQDTFHLGLLQVDDYDIAWVNGQKVGESYGKHNHRNYQVPSRILKPKGNVLVVRVFDVGGTGGFTTSPFWGNPILWGDWVYKKGEPIDAKTFPQPAVPNATPFSSPGVLFNANVAPLTSFPLKGVIWYQGEANADRAYEYRKLFPALIRDWRKGWDTPNLPFVFVQLANYGEESPEPKESNWAELREAQGMALALPHTGMATAIDIGEAGDIHPKNKADVGKRLGIAAMKAAYGKQIPASGPTFRQMHVENNEVTLSFDNAGTGLKTRDKYGYVRGFQLAGTDKKFYWAQATLAGDKVVVTSPKVQNPVAVRYAWDNNPGALDLYNDQGLPAVPFRTDTWAGITAKEEFREGPRF
jgi:sialate O-acetylesterase